MSRFRVYVTLKPGILDPEGATIARALGALGFEGVEEVRVGKVIELSLDGANTANGAASAQAARERVEEMCRRLLANPVIEEYSIEEYSIEESD